MDDHSPAIRPLSPDIGSRSPELANHDEDISEKTKLEITAPIATSIDRDDPGRRSESLNELVDGGNTHSQSSGYSNIRQGNEEGHVADDESENRNAGLPSDPARDHPTPESRDEKLWAQIKTLQMQLFELEQQTKPKLNHETLEAEWEKAVDTMGPEKARKYWKEEKRRETAALLLENASYLQGREWSKNGNDKARMKKLEDFEYSVNVLKLRREWERKYALHQRALRRHEREQNMSWDTDGDSDEIDALSDNNTSWSFGNSLHLLDMRYQFEKKMIGLRSRDKEQRRHIRRMMNTLKNPPSEKKKTDEEVIVSLAKPELNRVEWEQFEGLRNRTEELSFAIDVLIGEPIIESGGIRTRKVEKVTDKKTNIKHDEISDVSPLPERLRINSRQLIKVLSKIHGSDLIPFSGRTIVLVRPFKFLVFYDREIRGWIERLENKLVGMNLPGGTIPAEVTRDTDTDASRVNETALDVKMGGDYNENDGDVQREDGSKTIHAGQRDEVPGDDSEHPVALEHLKCLLKFMDTDVSPKVAYLNSPACQKVVFSDLWYLFRPGIHVIGSDGRQAYRVVSIRSVGHRAVDPILKWFDKSVAEAEETPISINCVYIDFDGKHLGPVARSFQIKRYDGERNINSLDIYPLRFYPHRKLESKDSGEAMEAMEASSVSNECLRDYLVERGKKFLKVSVVNLATVHPMYYAGPTLKSMDEVESQVVIDFEAAFTVEEHLNAGWRPELQPLIKTDQKEEDGQERCNAKCCFNENVHDDSYVDKRRNKAFMEELLPKGLGELPSVAIFPRTVNAKAPEAGLTDDDFIIMSYRVFGFILRNRKWAQLDLTYLSDVQPSVTKHGDGNSESGNNYKEQTAFNQLVLPNGHKDMIISLISQHFREKELARSHNYHTDIVRGKGKGLILLLHGAPGVGKTTTAEGIAEKFRKPLFQLTCGDLGTTAKEVEAALETNFALASRWGCVLLLDEADVFLAQRTKDDFVRNGLVAVFLRVLEYYSGILFLTTNRVGDFDEAFASRIHISLYYPELDKEKTQAVFKLNLQLIRDRFKGKPQHLELDEIGIGGFITEYWDNNPFDHWNGRQIRNACQTALALAEYEAQKKDPNAAVKLARPHLEVVASAYLDFSRYIKDIYGTHAARRAKEAGLRTMWVNEDGKLMGAVGPKEASMFQSQKRSRFKRRSQGQQPYHDQQQGQIPGQPPYAYQGQSTSHLPAPRPMPPSSFPQYGVSHDHGLAQLPDHYSHNQPYPTEAHYSPRPQQIHLPVPAQGQPQHQRSDLAIHTGGYNTSRPEVEAQYPYEGSHPHATRPAHHNAHPGQGNTPYQPFTDPQSAEYRG